jgi:hypothetical protein
MTLYSRRAVPDAYAPVCAVIAGAKGSMTLLCLPIRGGDRVIGLQSDFVPLSA